MATRMQIPFMALYLQTELRQIFQMESELSLLRTIELPDESDEGKGKARLFFSGGYNFRMDIEWHRGHYGLEITIKKIRASIGFAGNCLMGPTAQENAKEWMADLQRFAGPINWNWDDHQKARFEIEGHSLTALEMNASSRRNDIPEVEWTDSEHPRHNW